MDLQEGTCVDAWQVKVRVELLLMVLRQSQQRRRLLRRKPESNNDNLMTRAT
jgi:hypothetical protein